jgi:hypothetical protein
VRIAIQNLIPPLVLFSGTAAFSDSFEQFDPESYIVQQIISSDKAIVLSNDRQFYCALDLNSTGSFLSLQYCAIFATLSERLDYEQRVAEEKAAAELEKAAAERKLAEERAAALRKLAEEKAAALRKLAKEKTATERKVAEENAAVLKRIAEAHSKTFDVVSDVTADALMPLIREQAIINNCIIAVGTLSFGNTEALEELIAISGFTPESITFDERVNFAQLAGQAMGRIIMADEASFDHSKLAVIFKDCP